MLSRIQNVTAAPGAEENRGRARNMGDRLEFILALLWIGLSFFIGFTARRKGSTRTDASSGRATDASASFSLSTNQAPDSATDMVDGNPQFHHDSEEAPGSPHPGAVFSMGCLMIAERLVSLSSASYIATLPLSGTNQRTDRSDRRDTLRT